MAFCSNCGAEIAEGAKFCPSCGTAVNGQSVEVVADNNSQLSEREKSLDELSKMMEYFSQKKDLYGRLKNNQILTEIEWGYGKKPKKMDGVWKFLGMIPLICGWLYFLWDSIDSGWSIDISVLIVPFSCMIFSLLIQGYGKKKKTQKLKQLAQEKERLLQELQDYYNAYKNCPIGIEYTDPIDIEKIMDIVRSGRATRISDAINTILDDIHKETLEQNVREAARNSAEAAYLARKASKNASKAADSASRAELNSYWR